MKLFDDFEAVSFPEENLIFVTHMALPLNEHEQYLMDLLMVIPPKLEAAGTFLQQRALSKESISKIGALYAEHCQFEVGDAFAIPENGNRPLGNSDFPKGILNSTEWPDIFETQDNS